MALAKYFEDNQEVRDERMRDCWKRSPVVLLESRELIATNDDEKKKGGEINE